jgi:cyclase
VTTLTATGTSLFGAPAAFAGGLQELAPRTFAWLQPNGDLGESNAGLVVGDGESLLVDTLWDVRLTRRMLHAMATKTTQAPITYVVNTHSDGDHWWGNQLLPDARRITSRASAGVMAHELNAPARLESFRRLGKALLRGAELPLPGAGSARMRTFGRYIAGIFEPYDFTEVEATPAFEFFDGRLELKVAGRRVELIVVGPAHTPGDLIVWLPDERVVFAADVAFIGVTPVIWAGPTGNWLRALETIAALEPEVVVPGHGPICTVAELEPIARYLGWVHSAARLHFADGASPFAAAEAIATSSDFRSQEWADWIAPERIVVNCHIHQREARGELTPITPLQRMVIFEQMSRLAERLSKR